MTMDYLTEKRAALLAQIDAALASAEYASEYVFISHGTTSYRVLHCVPGLERLRKGIKSSRGFRPETRSESSLGVGMRAWNKNGLRGTSIKQSDLTTDPDNTASWHELLAARAG